MDERTALQFIAEDERIFLELLFQQSKNSEAEKQKIRDIISRYITGELEDENGFIKPGSLTDEKIDGLQSDLLSIYSDDNLDVLFEQSMDLMDARLQSIDELMLSLEIEEGILGSQVAEFEAIQNQQRKIAEGLIRGAHGDEGVDYTGSIERINEQMNEYRFNRNRDEWAKRQDLMETLEQEAGAGVSHSNSVAITSMATVDRELRRAQADVAGVLHGLYSGPFDQKTRPFCDEYLGQVKTWEFWDDLSNDMPVGLFDKPVSIYCGGINCRHHIIPWRLEWSNNETDLRDRYALVLYAELMKSRYEYDRLISYNFVA